MTGVDRYKQFQRPGRPRSPRAVDLFSGCGGLSEGLRQAGFKVIGAIECDPLAVETYRLNHKHVKVEPVAIQDVDPGAFRRRLKLEVGELDLLAGCPPCQGFSSMTTLNGRKPKSDARNELVFEFIRFVREFMPRTIMMENVPGLASDARIDLVCAELHRLKYQPEVKILNAANYGVPQRRRRMILLAGYNGVLPFAKPADTIKTVVDAFEVFKNMDFSDDPMHAINEKRSSRVQELIRLIPKNGGSRMDIGKDLQLPCHKSCDGFKDVYGRMSWNNVAPTITGGCCNPSKGRFLHPDKDRAITLREAALLQSFPPTYNFSLRRGKYAAAQMIGNALPPEFIRRHAAEIHRHIRNLSLRDSNV